MTQKFLLFIFVFFWTTHFPVGEITEHENKIIGELKFLSLSPKPGTVVAIKAQSLSHYRVCMNGRCITPSSQWKLLTTKAAGPEYQGMLIEDPEQGWFAFNYRLYRDPAKVHPTANLRLPASVQATLEEKEEEILTEQKYNQQLLKSSTLRLWSCHWVTPLKSFSVSSEFASDRRLPNGTVYGHTGVDLRASFVPVYAISDGKVLSTDTQVVSGNVINIDHGQGVVSRYLHLSEFKVQKDEEIRTGQLIGISGGTGRVEAPHLHWEIRIQGTPVDPVSTLRLMSQLCDQG